MTEQWQELKETIIELRDSNGTGTQQEVCKFLANYMDILEKQMVESQSMRDATEEERKSVKDYIESISKPTGVRFDTQLTDAKETIIKSALKYLVKRQIEEGSVGFAVDNDPDHDCCWDDVLAWLEAQPCEDCISRKQALDTLKTSFLGMSFERYKRAKRMFEQLPSVTPKGVTVTDFADKCKECGKIQNELAEDAVSRTLVHEAITASIAESENPYEMWQRIEALPPVTPKYTDEEIDRAQAVEQAYVDKMVELTVEETKKRYSDAIEKMRKTVDEMTEIHSDGEFYIKNVDAKWIISKYLCGADMSGGGEDEVSD